MPLLPLEQLSITAFHWQWSMSHQRVCQWNFSSVFMVRKQDNSGYCFINKLVSYHHDCIIYSTCHMLYIFFLHCMYIFFAEYGFFVDCNGKRSRPKDMKWSCLPLAFGKPVVESSLYLVFLIYYKTDTCTCIFRNSSSFDISLQI